MVLSKLTNLLDKYNITNILKVVIILLILFLAYRIFVDAEFGNSVLKLKREQSNIHNQNYKNSHTNHTNHTNKPSNTNIIEGFAESGITDPSNNIIYGNVITLMNKTNIPVYSGNTCTLILDNKYRIDTLVIVFNINPNNNPTDSTTSPYNGNDSIYIQFEDGNGNMRNMKADNINSESPPDFQELVKKTPDNNFSITLTSIKDENMLDIYTSKIIIAIGDKKTNVLDTYNDASGNKYISNFGIYGGTRDLMKYNDYSNLVSSLSSIDLPLFTNNPTSFDSVSNMDNYIFGPGADILVYALYITINPLLVSSVTQKSTDLSQFKTTAEPFPLKITYDNTLYPGNDFTLANTYYIRSDINSIQNQHAYIYFTKPIIANKISVSVKRILNVINNMNTTSSNKLNITELKAIGRPPQSADISTYKQTVNTTLQTSGSSDASNNICPSINELVDKQTKTQQICDNLEYQDKIKSEKLRLERNKQYLLKLQEQQNQVDQLNTVIQDLESKRKARATSGDQVRVLQYQNQKADASTIRDLANQRLQSQDNNKLFMDVKINTT